MTPPRKILYVSGTRADFGLMRACLELIAAHPALHLGIAVTGMHLSKAYGSTVEEIEATGLPIVARIPVGYDVPDGAQMARNIGSMLIGLVDAINGFGPDVVLVLGDRGEMLAGALASIHLNVPVVHIHGGERSGTVDEPVRHAISKLAHFHFVSTAQSRDRLVRMGEYAERVLVVGAPGLDGIRELAAEERDTLYPRYGLEPARELALLLYHPILQEASTGGEVVEAILDGLAFCKVQILALQPNSDAGSASIVTALQRAAAKGTVALVPHLPRRDYLAFLRHAQMLAGNSSSGIIEAATFGTPVVNVGSRQRLRERNLNVLDCEANPAAIAVALQRAGSMGRDLGLNVYGDGNAGSRIAAHLAELTLNASVMAKINVY